MPALCHGSTVFGRLTERNAWAVGLFMVLFGILLVLMTIALGG